MTCTVQDSILRIREFRIASGLAKSRLAHDAGVSEGILRDMDAKEWNPTLATIKKLEAIIPKDFVAPLNPPAICKPRADRKLPAGKPQRNSKEARVSE